MQVFIICLKIIVYKSSDAINDYSDAFLERSSSCNSKRSMMIER